MKSSIRYIVLPLVIGTLLLLVPLVRDFHIESAMLAAIVGCFWGMWNASRKNLNRSDGWRIIFILIVLYIAALPIFLYSLIAGCLNGHGIGFWILYPVPSVLFGYSIGRFLRLWSIPYRKIIGVIVLLLVAVGVLLIEFLHLPQVYFLNHVWGGWPGPIYDETVKMGWSLVCYRALTLAWVGVLWWLPALRTSTSAKTVALFCSLVLVLGYSQLPEMGIISPRSYLQQQLGGQHKTDHFIIYYDQSRYSVDEVGFIAQKHEFYFQQITDVLNLAPESFDNIESYLYGHPWQKKELVGAKFTSYVPVWLSQNQLHIAKQQIAGSLKHELVHVLSKQFGNALFNASWSIGLIEGLATAIAPSVSPVSTIDQIVVSEKPYPTIEQMETALSITGFWGGRSAVNYTQTGSFVRYLLRHHPAQNFKQAYKTSDISAAYRTPIDSLVKDWHRVLDSVMVDSTDKQVAGRLYGFPSLFEQQCPHVQSRFAQLWDRYQYSMAEQDTLKALQYLNKARQQAKNNLFVKAQWAYLNLKTGNFEKVKQHASKEDSSAESLMLYADAFMLDGQPKVADQYIDRAIKRLKYQLNTEIQEALQVRQNENQWKHHLAIVYDNSALPDLIFNRLNHRTQIRAMLQAISAEDWTLLQRYAENINSEKLTAPYFDSYIEIMERLAYKGRNNVVEAWIKRLHTLSLRNRYRQRLVQTETFTDYLNDNK